MTDRVLLMVLDGWGQAPPGPANALSLAETPGLDHLFATHPHSLLDCSGEAIGLPAGQIGNSEVGHLALGAGRIILQDLPRISQMVRDGTLASHPTLQPGGLGDGNVHLMGLASPGGVHSHLDQLRGLLSILAPCKPIFHAYLDGRDVPPRSALEWLPDLEQELRELGGTLGTVQGRFWGMDRDSRWNRIEKGYRALIHSQEVPRFPSARAGISAGYADGISDEFIEPFVLGGPPINDGDLVIHGNFRPDRARQMTQVLSDPDFMPFVRKPMRIRMVTLTEFDPDLNVEVLVPPITVPDGLGRTLALAGLRQLRVAETEKYAHVTYFFNGGIEEPESGEEHILIPSRDDVVTYDLAPAMSGAAIAAAVSTGLARPDLHFILVNFANCDMVGHTGILKAAVEACSHVDRWVRELTDQARTQGWEVLVTADHGNVERMFDEQGQPVTAHTNNQVPLLYVGSRPATLLDGGHADVAPTVLDLLSIDPPAGMTGHSLLREADV